MKHLVILGHPSDESFNKVIWDEIALLYEKYEQDVVLRDLYDIGFDPILSKNDIAALQSSTVSNDVMIEQEYIRNADIITFIYPIWWTGMPAIMKGYIDRVFSKGFAYSIENDRVKQLLKGKKVVIVNTHGLPANLYLKSGVYDSMNVVTDKSIFEFCGMEVIFHYYIENVNPDSDRNLMKTQMENLILEIRKTLFLGHNSRLTIPTPF